MRALSVLNPANRFSSTELAYDDGEAPVVTLDVYEDRSRQILSKNDSPDVGFTWSANPYRGCYHACAYCYARPSHEYLSFGAGTDFERKIVIKPDAPDLLREAFNARSWQGDVIVFSGITDCYQPLESKYQLTRRCLEVCAEYKNPFSIITKSPLVERDIDVLLRAAAVTDVRVSISLPIFDREIGRAIEPGVPPAERRIKTIERLSAAGLEVGVMVAPIIPGLTDEDVPTILEAARAAGARYAGRVLLRLPHAVKEVFEQRLREALPLRADRVLNRLREAYGGKLYDSAFGVRGRGDGPYAATIAALFEKTAQRLGFQEFHHQRRNTFERPLTRGPQLALF